MEYKLSSPRKHLTSSEEVVDADSSLSKNGAQRSFSHISGATRYGNFPTSPCMTPNFVTARPRTVERIAEMPQAPGNISILEPGEPPPLRHADGYQQIN